MPNQDLDQATQLMMKLLGSQQQVFVNVVSGKSLIANKVVYPDSDFTATVRSGIHSLVEGALTVYVFALWESHMPIDVEEWLTADEKEELDAFRHVRDSAAHKSDGGRADFNRRRQAFESRMPFSGIVWDQVSDTIDLSDSSVAFDCFKLIERLTTTLITRLHEDRKP